jgi:hypothetical protein
VLRPAAQLLERGTVSLRTRRRVSQLAGLAGAFGALRLRPPRLLDAIAEALKQEQVPTPLALLGPWESVMLVWAFGRLAGRRCVRSVDGGGAGRPAYGPAPPPSPVIDEALWPLLLERASALVRRFSLGARSARPGRSR